MKKIYEKIAGNKALFSTSMIIIFFIADILIWWVFSDIVLIALFKIFKTSNGINLIAEVILFLLVLPLIFIFKNKYIFKEKRKSFIESLLLVWPMVFLSIVNFIVQASTITLADVNFFEILSLCVLCVFIGLAEEFLCRGWLQNEFIERFGDTKKNVIFSIVISSCLFGIMHFCNILTGQPVINTIFQVISAIIGGLVFGILYYRTKNIWAVVFIHAFWDFAILFGNINVLTSCVEIIDALPFVLNIIGNLISLFFISLPQILLIIILLNRIDINKCLSEEKQIKYTEEEIKSSLGNKKTITIVLTIYLLLWGSVSVYSSLNVPSKNNCPIYYEMKDASYNEYLVNMKNGKIILSHELCKSYDNIGNCLEMVQNQSEIKLSINEDDKLEIFVNSNFVELDYENVDNFAIIENENTYDILVSSYHAESNAYIIYHSNYITKENSINDINDINGLKKSFKQLFLPNILYIGYYNENNNNYPLFVAENEIRYVLYSDDNFYKYERKK